MRTRIVAIALTGVALLGGFAGVAIAQQDRYALKSGKLSFGDFKGYENWRVVAVSREDNILKVILGNDVMIGAYKQGLPADGKSFPEGSKVVKIEWSLKKNPQSPYAVDVPDELQVVGTIEKDSKRFPTRMAGRMASSIMPPRRRLSRRRAATPSAAMPATPGWRHRIISSQAFRLGR